MFNCIIFILFVYKFKIIKSWYGIIAGCQGNHVIELCIDFTSVYFMTSVSIIYIEITTTHH